MQFFDAHTHLNHNDLYIDRQIHLQNFIDAGGIGLVNIGVDHSYNTRGIEISRHARELFPHTTVKATIGLHPYEIAIGNITKENRNKKIDELQSLYTQENKDHIVAIGEIGIDTYRPDTDDTLALQKEIFRLQCEWARKIQLPIVIHSRSNREATHDILQHFTDLTIYFHCRPYGPEQVQIIKETYPDFFIGFCGNISYPKADNIRKSLRYLTYNNTDYPEYIITGKGLTEFGITIEYGKSHNKDEINNKQILESNIKELGTTHILVETDAPYLPIQSKRGKQNTPVGVKDNYKYISTLLGIDISTEVISNTKKCYRIK